MEVCNGGVKIFSASRLPALPVLQILESMLGAMHVRYMLVPCVTSLLGMWVHKLGFEPVTSVERVALEDQIILLDPDTVHLVKRQMYRYLPFSLFPQLASTSNSSATDHGRTTHPLKLACPGCGWIRGRSTLQVLHGSLKNGYLV